MGRCLVKITNKLYQTNDKLSFAAKSFKMNILIHRSEDRGQADHGWLNARHSFSFASFFDKTRIQFGALRVLNDDWVTPSMGFATHPHDNMEIVTIPLAGAIRHKDSTGAEGGIETGDVQIMSAGSGIRHSEFNASHYDMLNLLQIWVFPKVQNINPRYEQKTYFEEDRINKFQTIVSPEKGADSVWINQDAWFSLATLNEGFSLNYQFHLGGNGAYMFVIDGLVSIGNEELHKRDAAGITNSNSFEIKAQRKAYLLVIEVPMNY